MAAILFSFLPIRKNGLIAPFLIALSVVSVLPPMDAFTLSNITQIKRLEAALVSNNMLSEDTITPNGNIAKEDKEAIISSIQYLDRMDYTKEIDYLSSYAMSFDFHKTFGFSGIERINKEYRSYYYSRNINDPIPISGQDYMLQLRLYHMADTSISSFDVDGSLYTLRVDNTDRDNQLLVLEDSQGQELLRYEYSNLFSRFNGEGNRNELLSTKEMTYHQENELAAMTMIANHINYNERAEGKDMTADLIVLIDIR